jgi:pilus assembly protein Flp/PilA
MSSPTILLNEAGEDCAKGEAVVRLIKEESGVTAIEYALIAALVAVAAIAAFTFLGAQLGVEFSAVANQL